MPRVPRLHVPGVLYAVTVRSNGGQTLFADEADYARFLDGMRRANSRCDCVVLCFALMPDHVHVLVQSGNDPIGRLMQPLLTGYSVYVNRRNRRNGHVFQGRYRAILCEKNAYLWELVSYYHRNPVRAGLVRSPDDWRWTSHMELLGKTQRGVIAPRVIRDLLDGFGGRRAYLRALAGSANQPSYRPELHPSGAVPILGSEQFVRQVNTVRPMQSRRNVSDTQVHALAEATAREAGISMAMLHGELRLRTVTQARRRLIVSAVRTLGCSQARIARLLGCDQSYISRVLAEGTHENNT